MPADVPGPAPGAAGLPTRAVLDTNIGGVFNLTRAVARHMISKRSGRIVSLSSVAATKGGRGTRAPYGRRRRHNQTAAPAA